MKIVIKTDNIEIDVKEINTSCALIVVKNKKGKIEGCVIFEPNSDKCKIYYGGNIYGATYPSLKDLILETVFDYHLEEGC